MTINDFEKDDADTKIYYKVGCPFCKKFFVSANWYSDKFCPRCGHSISGSLWI